MNLMAEWLQQLGCPLPTGRCWMGLGVYPMGSADDVPCRPGLISECALPGDYDLGTTCRSLGMQHISTEFGKDCKWFALSHKPWMVGLNSEGEKAFLVLL